MVEFLNGVDWTIVAGIAIALIVAIALVIRSGKNIKVLSKASILEAERLFKSETGQAKFIWVVGKVYEKLPSIIKTFYSKAQIEKLVQESFEILKNTALEQVKVQNAKEDVCSELITGEVVETVVENSEDKYTEGEYTL